MTTSFVKIADTYPVDGAANPIVVFTPDPDKKFVVTKYLIMADAPGTVQFMSGANPLSGVISLIATQVISDGDGNGMVFKGRANGEAFSIANAATVALRGYAVIGEVQQ